MAALTYQTMDFAGTTPSYAAAAGGGDTVTPDEVGFLHVKNGGGSPITVTLTVAGNSEFGQPNADNPVVVTNGDSKMIGPLVTDFTGADTFGVVLIAYSGVTSVTVAALRHPGQQPSLP